MKARAPEDRMAFYLSIERIAPQVWKSLADERHVKGAPFSHADAVAFLRRWGLDGGCEWLVEDALVATLSEPVGIPATGAITPTHDEVLSLSWEPAEDGLDRGAFRQRALAALDRYLDRVEAWAAEAEIEIPSPERPGRRARLPRGMARWDVLVKHVVLARSYQALADEYDTTFSAVGERVRDLANRLGMTLTPNENR